MELELELQRDIYNRGGFGEELEWYVAGVAHFWYARQDMLS
jgi:hypothetical protein